MRLGARVVGKRVGALVVGMATGATVVGAAVGVAANRTRISCWHMGRMGVGPKGMGGGACVSVCLLWVCERASGGGGDSDMEVVLGGGFGTAQYWQYFGPSPPPLPLLLHKPHRLLTVDGVSTNRPLLLWSRANLGLR